MRDNSVLHEAGALTGVCAAACADVPPPPGQYTCAQQKGWGKCGASFMVGYCLVTCGTCPAASPQSASAPAATVQPAPSTGKFDLYYMLLRAHVLLTRCCWNLRRPLNDAGQISAALPSPPTGGTAGICNSYVPSDSLFNRFIYVIQFLTLNGLYVILDNQLNFDTTVLQSQTAWIQVRLCACAALPVLLHDQGRSLNKRWACAQGWQRLATAVNANPITAHRIMYDILNEPDSFNIGWQPAGGRPGMQDLYPLAMDAIYAINPGKHAVAAALRL